MAKDFKLTNLANFSGYINKADFTNVSDNFLIVGSQNVVTTDEGTIANRKGFTLKGAANTDLEPIEDEFSWKTARGDEIMIRSHNDATDAGTFEFFITSINAWTELIDNTGTGSFNATTFWDTTEGQDALLFVVGDSNIYEWSGGVTTYASSTAATITKEGTTSWSEEGFLIAGTRKVVIGGVEFTYTGGESTTTLTGVTPNAVAAGSVGDTVFQAVRTTSNKPASGLSNDLIANLRNQIYVGDLKRRDVNISKVGDFTDYAFSSPRLVGEGALITLNETPTAFIEDEDSMYMSTANQWYKTDIVLSEDLLKETIIIRLLKSNFQGGAINQASVFKIKNNILYISNEPTVNSLGRVAEVDTPQSRDLSDPIKLELEGLDRTNAAGKFWRNSFYLTFPVESKTLIYNIEKGYWEPPQVLPTRRYSVFEGDLIGHSNAVTESYTMFDEFNDNGNAMEAIAAFSYLNFARRDHKKNLTEWFTEGYITSNTKLTQTLNYDYKAATQTQDFDIDGDDTSILFQPAADNSLGKSPLGSEPLGSSVIEPDVLNKFRVIKTTSKQDFYEIQVIYSSNAVDQRWEVLAQGAAAQLSTADNVEIKQ